MINYVKIHEKISYYAMTGFTNNKTLEDVMLYTCHVEVTIFRQNDSSICSEAY